MDETLSRAAEIIEQHGCAPSNLISIMQEIQAEYSYLSEEALTLVADRLGISVAKVYGVATLETVACLGACSLAPAMTVDGAVCAKMTPESAVALLEEIRTKEAAGV